MLPIRFLKSLLYTTLIVALSCTKKLPDNIEASLSQYFISKDIKTYKKALSSLRKQKQIDSLFLSILEKSKSGPAYTNLLDKGKRKFTLGYTTPDTFNKTKSYPLIIYLHGGIGTTRTDKGKDAWKMFQFLQDSIDIFIASPSANRECPWWTNDGIDRILMSVRFMTLNYPIDPDRIFLAGVSDGGTACYAVANQTESLFAGFFPISGLGAVLNNLGITLYSQNLMQENIYNINAGNDRLYPIKYVNQFISSLRDQGVNIKSKVYPDELHGFDYKLKETNELLNLIRMWKRNSSISINNTLNKNTIYYNPNISNIEFKKTDNSFINFYCSKDTIIVRSKGIKSFKLLFEQNDQLFLKKGDRVVKLKAYLAKDVDETLSNSFHPKRIRKNYYNISLE